MAELRIDFPTLGHLLDAWYAQHLVIPDGWDRGQPFEQSRWQYWCTASFYRVRETAALEGGRPIGAQAFTFRKGIIVGPQKSGKGPWSAGVVAGEAVGPSQFAGWAKRGDVYECSENGCPCGWVYEYEPGEPMGRRHPSPLIQLAALAEDQVANVYGPLTEMVGAPVLSPLLQVREGFIRVLGGSLSENRDRIDVVTAKARTKLGNPISFALQDEFGTWMANPGAKQNMLEFADTQDRGAAGMNGRTLATTNAYDPAENSAAQIQIEQNDHDVFVYWDKPPSNLRFDVADERREIIEYVYRDSPWVSVDTILAQAASTAKRDPGQAERFFGNRDVRGKHKWFTDELLSAYRGKRSEIDVFPGARVGLGMDGSKNDDWTAIRLETLDQHQFTPTYTVGGVERLCVWRPEEWGGEIPRQEVREAVRQIHRRFEVVRGYYDPFWWESEIDDWADTHGPERVVRWPTNSIKNMHAGLERFRHDSTASESRFTHDGCEWMERCVSHAITRARSGEMYIIGKPEPHLKIDVAMSGVLAHEAVMDALAKGLRSKPEKPRISHAVFGFS
ncbi:hypothetical protein [Gulosibacter sp. 10]|uniref:hypothetical protein n=1 Tax=Gulosibacter sp. 10 TaxID=1255570 RepID=UPI000B355B9F|nr:hypothetical protein [Gulosibacter sp. 10]